MVKKHFVLQSLRQVITRLKIRQPTKELSILLPAYNEAHQIERCLLEVEKAVKAITHSYEIIVSEDGSSDPTAEIVEKMAKSNANLVLLHSPLRLGKGKAVKNALTHARGSLIAFMDVDLATDLVCLPKLLDTVKEEGGLAIGSRHVKGSCVKRSISRTFFSLTYNILARLLFLDGIRDHQCGFKTMSQDIAKVVLSYCKSDGYFFDTEMIINCKKLGYPVTEVAVNWIEKNQNESKINPLADAKRIGIEILAFRLKR